MEIKNQTESFQMPEIIGLPPDDPNILPNGYPKFSKIFMPIMTLVPKKPRARTDFTVYQLEDAVTEYNEYLNSIVPGVSIDRALKIAFLLENAPSETFSTQYGQSFLESTTGAVSTAAADVAFITGASNAVESLKRLSAAMKTPLPGEKEAGNIPSFFGSIIGGTGSVLESIQKRLAAHGFGKLANIVSGLLAGNRVDFPEVWKGSSFEPSYSFTVRLYNPDPSSLESTKKYIIAPLASLLLFVVPQVPDKQEYMFKYPFLCSVNCPGLFKVKYGAISSINVIKGGDQTNIAYNQVPGMIDLRIELHELFETLVARKKNQKGAGGIPSLKAYLDNIVDPNAFNKTDDLKVVREAKLETFVAENYTQGHISNNKLLLSNEPQNSKKRVSESSKLVTSTLENQMPVSFA